VSHADARPTRLWAGVDRLAILCADTADPLCRRLAEIAAAGAPIPVTRAEPGDGAVDAPGTLALVVETGPGGATIRPRRRVHADEAAGFAPVAIAVAVDDAPEARDAVLRAALGRLVPWLAPRGRPVPFPGPKSN